MSIWTHDQLKGYNTVKSGKEHQNRTKQPQQKWQPGTQTLVVDTGVPNILPPTPPMTAPEGVDSIVPPPISPPDTTIPSICGPPPVSSIPGCPGIPGMDRPAGLEPSDSPSPPGKEDMGRCRRLRRWLEVSDLQDTSGYKCTRDTSSIIDLMFILIRKKCKR